MIRTNLEQSLTNEEPTPSSFQRRSSFIEEEEISGMSSTPKKSKDTTTPYEQHRPTSSTSSRSKKKSNGPERLLPTDFEPSSWTVQVGRGKRIAQTIGNQRLRVMAKTFLPEYAKNMRCKAGKTRIVGKIVDIIKSACADNHCEAAFVRYSKGRCYEVDDSVAREKVGYQLRDLLGDRYESSSKRKVAKKHRIRVEQERKERAENGEQGKWKLEEADAPKVVSPYPPPTSSMSTMVSAPTIDASLMAPIPLPYYDNSPRPRRAEKRLSFDAMQLLNLPLRGSFVLEETTLQFSMV